VDNHLLRGLHRGLLKAQLA